MSQTPPPPFETRFLHPRFWGIWIGLFILWPLAFLPWSIQRMLGVALGDFIYLVGKRRRHDTLTNLRLCFSEKTDAEHQWMARDVFRQAGMGVFESLSAWYSPNRFERQITISGLHHLIEQQQAGKSVLMLGAHYTSLDLAGLLASKFFAVDTVYRPQNNPLLEWVICRARLPIYGEQIDHDDMRKLVRCLKNKHVVWYTPDQDFGLKQGVMAPFFGVPAATLIAQRRLCKIDQSAVMAVHFYRQHDRRPHYHITITPVLLDYPSTDEVADATRVNELLESLIRIAPTQYMWFHRRFKTRPDGMPKIYS